MRHRERIRKIDGRLERGDQLMAEIRDAVRDIRAEFELNRREFELNRAEAQNGREVTRELIAGIREMREQSRRHNDAVVGALTDLAAEIRGWGGGAATAG